MSDIYAKIKELENEIQQKKKQLAELRKSVPEKQVQNYKFITFNDEHVTLLDLFGDKNELFIIHNMGKNCSYCTMWADGFNGVYHHLAAKAGFVVSSPDAPKAQASIAAERQWKFQMISVKEHSFTADMGFRKDGHYYPGVSTFRKDEQGNIFLYAHAPFAPGDDYCVPWHLFDLLPSGSNNVKTKQKLNPHSPFQLTNQIAVGVNNYEKAISFYQNVIGMKLEQTFDNVSKLTICGISFYLEENEENPVFFEFSVEDLHAAKNFLIKNGCTITKEYSSTSVRVKDPFGLTYHVYESYKGDPKRPTYE
ncbi:DUF899 family protein [Fredinandcohnia humi]